MEEKMDMERKADMILHNQRLILNEIKAIREILKATNKKITTVTDKVK